ncbi:RES family NAD+ phosphorylase [Methylobacterium nigriterrae]|uniref:RES family NAD+ phosphorylase n=1 Tax=Methylobacterium nigriterrae TaxID=3127512 RepID=UPI003013AFE7
MRIPLRRLQSRTTLVTLGAWPRIIPSAHKKTPAGAGFGSSRFSSPSRSFRVLYAAEDFPTAFSEAVVRDRMEGKQLRFLYRPQLEALMATNIGSTAGLKLLDLTNGGAYELGIDTDTSRSRAHSKGQTFSEALHAETDFDGILFNSRLTTGKCVAIYDRAFARLAGSTPTEIVRLDALYTEVQRLGITIRRAYGTGNMSSETSEA